MSDLLAGDGDVPKFEDRFTADSQLGRLLMRRDVPAPTELWHSLSVEVRTNAVSAIFASDDRTLQQNLRDYLG
ncbi:MAG: hypothetical protein ACREN6_02670, partial [Gemmatimonadaceae bacterium]